MWEEETEALQHKGVRKVRTPAGVREFHQPVGTPILAHPDLPRQAHTTLSMDLVKERVGKEAAAEEAARKKAPVPPKKVDKRTVGGQTKSNFVHPVTGHTMGKTEVGDTFEQLFQAKMKRELEGAFGCCLKLITGAGEGTNRTTPLDFSLGKEPPKGGEVKTLNARAQNQKTAIKKEEVARKVQAVQDMGGEPMLVVQVVDQDTGTVRVYSHSAFASKTVKSMLLLGEYKFSGRDFEKAQKAAGHWDKKEGRAADQAAKATAEGKAWWVYMERKGEELAKLGDEYDPPDEEGGTIEPGDTVIQLIDVDGHQVPHIYTFPEKNTTETKDIRRVRSREGVDYYDRPIGSPIAPHPHAPIPSWDMPTVREPKPLYDGPTRPPHINPRDFDDFLDSIDPRLTERWRNASVPDFWAWVVSQPGDDQARITQATARMLTLMRQKGLGWLVDLEGKSAVRHMGSEGEVKMDRATVLNEDWVKAGTWDIWLGSRLVKTMAELTEYCDRQGMSLSQFVDLPAAQAMPEELKLEIGLWRQERLAGMMATQKEDHGKDVDPRDVIGQLIERKLFGHKRKQPEVSSEAGVRKYKEPLGTPIVDKPNVPHPHVHVPGGGGGGSHAGGGGSHAGGGEESGGTLHAGHFGKMPMSDWLDGLDQGKYKSWSPIYKAAWLDPDGEVDAVADHNAIPGDKAGAFATGKIRIALVGWENPEKRTLHFQIQGKAGKKQVSTMMKLAEEIDAREITINVGGNDRGEGEPVNGEWVFATAKMMWEFLSDPTKRPEKREQDARMAVYAQFKEEEGEGLQAKGTDDDITFWDAVDLSLDTEWDTKAAVRRVKTPEGVRFYRQPLHAIITPDLLPGRMGRAAQRLTERHPGVVAALEQVMSSQRQDRERTQTSLRARWHPDDDRQELALSKLMARHGEGPGIVDGEEVEDVIRTSAVFREIRNRLSAKYSEADIEQLALDVEKTKPVRVPVASIIATKQNLKRDSVAAVIHAVDDPTGPWARPDYIPIVLRVKGKTPDKDELYLWNGHHRLEGHRVLGESEMDVRIIDLPKGALKGRPEIPGQLTDEDRDAIASFPHDAERPQLEEMLRRRRAVEPEMTKALQETALASGGKIPGRTLPFKYKDAFKVNEKIDRYVQGRGISPAEAIDKLADSLRYTAEFESAAYADGVRNMIAAMEEQGFVWDEVENFWPKGDAYNGINAIMVHPSGLKVELQFHTPESFHVKQDLNHRDYEWFRAEPKNGTRDEREAVFNRMRDQADGVPYPVGWEDIGIQVLRPFDE